MKRTEISSFDGTEDGAAKLRKSLATWQAGSTGHLRIAGKRMSVRARSSLVGSDLPLGMDMDGLQAIRKLRQWTCGATMTLPKGRITD